MTRSVRRGAALWRGGMGVAVAMTMLVWYGCAGRSSAVPEGPPGAAATRPAPAPMPALSTTHELAKALVDALNDKPVSRIVCIGAKSVDGKITEGGRYIVEKIADQMVEYAPRFKVARLPDEVRGNKVALLDYYMRQKVDGLLEGTYELTGTVVRFHARLSVREIQEGDSVMVSKEAVVELTDAEKRLFLESSPPLPSALVEPEKAEPLNEARKLWHKKHGASGSVQVKTDRATYYFSKVPDGVTVQDPYEAPDGTRYDCPDRITVEVTSPRNGYLTLIDIDQDGKVYLLVPNKVAPTFRISAGSLVKIGDFKTLEIFAAPPAGVNRLKALVTEQPIEGCLEREDVDLMLHIEKALADASYAEGHCEFAIAEKEFTK